MHAVPVLSALLVAMLASTPIQAQAPAAGDGGAGQIGGRVVTPYAERLAGATVTLATRAGSSPIRTVRTTASGTFSFDQVRAGDYVLAAFAPGYTDRAIDADGARPPRDVTVAEGEPRTDVELVLRRTGSIAGRILKPDGTPAPGVLVMPAVRQGSRVVRLAEWRTTSQWDGRYEMTGLPPGDLLVLVVPAAADAAPAAPSLPVDVSSEPLAFEPTLYPGVPQAEPGGPVTVYEGVATEGIDVWLLPAPQRFTVSGRVFWPEGVRAEDITIEYGGSPEVRSGVWYIEDPGGLFTLEGISQGTLLLLAHADSNRGPLAGIAATDVGVGPVEEVRLTLSPPGSVAGRVVFDTSAPPETAARVALVHTLLTVSALFASEEAPVESDGRFRIPHARGTYRIEVHGLPEAWRIDRILRNGTPLTGDRLLVGSDDHVGGLEIHVARAATESGGARDRAP